MYFTISVLLNLYSNLPNRPHLFTRGPVFVSRNPFISTSCTKWYLHREHALLCFQHVSRQLVIAIPSALCGPCEALFPVLWVELVWIRGTVHHLDIGEVYGVVTKVITNADELDFLWTSYCFSTKYWSNNTFKDDVGFWRFISNIRQNILTPSDLSDSCCESYKFSFCFWRRRCVLQFRRQYTMGKTQQSTVRMERKHR